MGRSGQGTKRGQVALEAAIAVPIIIGLLLSIAQLALLQQARLLATYAAFCAARSAMVWSGDPEKMRRAAIWALLPALGRSDSPEAAAATLRRHEETAGEWTRVFSGSPQLTVQLAVKASAFRDDELDFDGVGLDDGLRAATLPEVHVRFWFELAIPFASTWLAWAMAAQRLGDPAGALPASIGGRIFVPVAASYRLRMQSNLFRSRGS